MTVLLLAVAGGLGALCRYVADGAGRARTHPDDPVPVALVNVTGSFLLGLLVGVLGTSATDPLLLVAGTGFCGGFTTFSTSLVVTVELVRRRRFRAAAALAAGTLLATVAAAAIGIAAGAAATR